MATTADIIETTKQLIAVPSTADNPAALRAAIDILAGIPSVVYGMWGVLVIVPLVSQHLAPMFGTWSSGYCVLSGGIVLAVMISPVIIHM